MSERIEALVELHKQQSGGELSAEFLGLLETLSTPAGEATAVAALAASAWPPFNSAHEGYAVLLEEVHELQAHVFTNQRRRDLSEMRMEALQVAAMAIRFVHDVCDSDRGRK